MYLQKIIDYKRQELEHLRRKISLKDVRLKAGDTEPARDFLGALRAKGHLSSQIIAEIKKASPSAGVIRPDLKPLDVARSFEVNGAAALSILTDEHFFQGSLDSLQKIRKTVKIPLLRKDFTLDEYHLYEARGAGADAVLLIVCVLSDSQLKDYQDLTKELGMISLVEVHETQEVERAQKSGAVLFGINNRNLETFEVDLETSVKLAKTLPAEALGVGESGISERSHIEKLKKAGIHAFLIGEVLMKSPDPGKKLAELLRI